MREHTAASVLSQTNKIKGSKKCATLAQKCWINLTYMSQCHTCMLIHCTTAAFPGCMDHREKSLQGES